MDFYPNTDFQNSLSIIAQKFGIKKERAPVI